MSDSGCRTRSCCCCYPLSFGTIFSGIGCIILCTCFIFLLWFTDVQIHTIVMPVDTVLTKIIVSINLVMTILISILMMVGAVTKRTTLMLPWIVLGIILVLGLFISVLFTSVRLLLKDDEVYRYLYGSVILLVGTIVCAFYLYLWFVVYSFYQELRIEKCSMKIGPYGKPYSYKRP